MDWPKRNEGTFRRVWSQPGNDTKTIYGRMQSGGGARGGRAGGLPFAIVTTTAPDASPQLVHYRFKHKSKDRHGNETEYWSDCPASAYCWVQDQLPHELDSAEGEINLTTLASLECDFALLALWRLCKHIDKTFQWHQKTAPSYMRPA